MFSQGYLDKFKVFERVDSKNDTSFAELAIEVLDTSEIMILSKVAVDMMADYWSFQHDYPDEHIKENRKNNIFLCINCDYLNHNYQLTLFF